MAGREKASSLSNEQKVTLVQLITTHRVVLDKSGNYLLISKKKEAWEKIAEGYNAAYPVAEAKTGQQLKRAWEYIRNKLKTEFAKYAKKKKATGGGPPPTPPKFTPLMEAAASLIQNELEMAELQYDSSCREVPVKDVESPLPETCIVLQEGDYEWIEEPQADLGVPSTSGQDPTTSGQGSSISGQHDDGHRQDITVTRAIFHSQVDGTPARTPARGAKRKRLEDKASVLESLKISQEKINQCQLELLREKHNKEMEVLDSKKKMFDSITNLVCRLAGDYEKIFNTNK